MIVLLLTFYQHVINIDLDISSNLMCEHLVHEPLICRTCVLETERHHFVAKEALVSDEQSLLLIFFVHFYPVIAKESVHEAQQLVLSCRVY